ncbi:MAG: hypothetical protein JEZ06_17410 [Anaerolineaceae bacterium]|nr:hypothetical protein [Anaerolineaceae bacterium]
MKYSTFRNIWDDSLRSARFQLSNNIASETINIETTDREYQSYMHIGQAHGFHTSIYFNWIWDALLSARFVSTEEDMLMQIFGDFGIHEDTDTPTLRVDYSLSATVPGDQYLPISLQDCWQKWANRIKNEVVPLMTYDDLGETFPVSICNEPEIKAICSNSGQFYLSGVSLSAFRLITLPRNWDDSDRHIEPDSSKQLLELFQRLSQAVALWQESLETLQK